MKINTRKKDEKKCANVSGEKMKLRENNTLTGSYSGYYQCKRTKEQVEYVVRI